MTSRNSEKRSDDETITRGTANVFADLGYADAEERQTKLRLAYAINEVIARQRVTQANAAEKLGVNQPKISALANYKRFAVLHMSLFPYRYAAACRPDRRLTVRRDGRRNAWK